MRRNTLKLFACASVMAVGLAASPIATRAATVDVGVSVVFSSTLTLVKDTDMDFGEWFVQNGSTANTNTTIILTTTDTVSGSAGTSDTIVKITDTTGSGQVSLTTAASASVTLSASISAFAESTIVLSAITYNPNATGSASLTSTTFTTTGVTADVITLGGTITIADAVPSDGTYDDAYVTIGAVY